MDEILSQPDVWFVTNWQAIQWMKKTITLEHLREFQPWSCNRHFRPEEIACDNPNACKTYSKVFQQYRHLYTCSDCPEKYPWVKNEFGTLD